MKPRNLIINTSLLILAGLLIFLGVRNLKGSSKPKAVNGSGVQIYCPDFDVNAMVIRDSILWMGGKSGIAALSIQTKQVLALPPSAESIRFVSGMVVDSLNNLWIGFEKGLARFDGLKMTFLDTTQGLPDTRVTTVYLDRMNQLWVGTWSGAAVFKNGSWEVIRDELIHPMVNVIYQDSHLDYWFGSYVAPRGGISYHSNGAWQHWSIKEGMPHPNVTAIVENDEAYWFGTGLFNHGGLFKIDKPLGPGEPDVSVITQSDGLAGDKVRSLFIDSQDRIWMGFEYDGITLIDPNGMRSFDTQNGLSNAEVKCFLEDSIGFWIGTRRGLSYLLKNTLVWKMDNP